MDPEFVIIFVIFEQKFPLNLPQQAEMLDLQLLLLRIDDVDLELRALSQEYLGGQDLFENSLRMARLPQHPYLGVFPPAEASVPMVRVLVPVLDAVLEPACVRPPLIHLY